MLSPTEKSGSGIVTAVRGLGFASGIPEVVTGLDNNGNTAKAALLSDL